MLPATSVPVTTVPNPFMLNTRSMGRRGRALESLAGISAAAATRACFKRSNPAPDTELTGIMGALRAERNDPRRNSSTSNFTTSSVSRSTRSDFVSTAMPRRTASSRQMSKCSLVCGLIPSSAATTSSTKSIPPTPASMLRTKRSWPGTSTKPRRIGSPSGPVRSRCANPMSMVMPRRFSSSRRSVSIPVRAFTKAVLP